MLNEVKVFLQAQGKGVLLLLTMGLGMFLPGMHKFSFFIQYLLLVMLFLAFLDIEFKPQKFQRSLIWVLLANVAVAFICYMALVPFDLTFALAAFMTAIAPTAIAAPVIIGLIQREVEYVVASVLLTNITSAVIIPLTLPSLLGAKIPISIWEVLQPVMVVMFVPLILARLVSFLPFKAQIALRKGKSFSFPLWLINLFIISANASSFLRNTPSNSTLVLITIASISLAICIVNFGLGAFLGGRHHWQEASQSLGQKNLSFVIWIALTFINPLVAMGPMFYILYHHIYNSWSIYQFEKRRRA
jgi:bile acid:Na+ symporter, BASS family